MIRKRINPSVDMLRRMPLFDGCSRRQLQLVGLVADEVLVRPGFSLIRQGEIPRDCFIVIEGEAEVLVDGLPVAAVGAPTLIGAQSLRNNTRRTSSARTTDTTRIFSFGVRGFHQLMDLPPVAERILSGRYAVPECLISAPLLPPIPRPNTAPLLAADAHLV